MSTRILTFSTVREINAREVLAIAGENVKCRFNSSQLGTCIEHDLLAIASKCEPQAFGSKFTEARDNRH